MTARPARRLGVLAGFVGILLGAAACSRPKPQDRNLLFVLVDTLRADAVFPGKLATPTLDRLASQGTVFTRSYAQASWTLPSVSSLLTGRWPSESPGWADATQGIPGSAVSLAEILRDSGRQTAAFVANPLLNRDRGFGRGFDIYWTAPTANSVFTPAAEPVDQAIAWLKQHQRSRFFVLLHLMDPHDPYCPPARRVGPQAQWPGQPDPAFTGAAPMPDAATIRQWRELYAEEVSYLDGQLSRLFAALDPGVRARTVVVFTSDHGEEFLEHGYLKHAVTLFDESVHVPLLVQAPGGPGGRRVDQVVRLVDVVPTVADLLGVAVSSPLKSRWAGVSLAGAVVEKAPVPPLLAMGETFGFGPMRWYVYDGRTRVVLFNRDHDLPSEIPALPFPNQWLRGHLPPEEVYVSTPEHPADVPSAEDREKKLVWAHNLAARYAMGKIGGLWFSLRGTGRGGRLTERVEIPASPERVRVIPLFWRAGDRVRQEGGALTIDVADDGITRLLVVVGGAESALPGIRVAPGEGSVPARPGRPDSEEAGLRYWFEPEAPRSPGAPAARNEMLFRLRALGYIH